MQTVSSFRRPRRGFSLVEPLVALLVFAVGALGAAALFAHAARRLNRAAQITHTRDAALSRLARDASRPCDAFARGVQPLHLSWNDSASFAPTARPTGAPCTE